MYIFDRIGGGLLVAHETRNQERVAAPILRKW
jgi:hypothetical protein